MDSLMAQRSERRDGPLVCAAHGSCTGIEAGAAVEVAVSSGRSSRACGRGAAGETVCEAQGRAISAAVDEAAELDNAGADVAAAVEQRWVKLGERLSVQR